MNQPECSIVIPVYNEEPVLPTLLERLDALVRGLGTTVEVILVDDGSHDRSGELIRAAAASRPWLRYARLSRNFGHQAALTAGYDLARGRAVVCLDADLQDPPEVVATMLARWREGCEIVYGVRTARSGESLFKRWSAWAFYRLVRTLARIELPVDVGDFRLLDRRVIEALRGMRERHRYLRGMVAWLGFRQCCVPFQRDGRAAGSTKYSMRRMLRLACDGLLSFSQVPLRLALWLGFAMSALAMCAGIAAIALKLSGHYTVDGWTSLAVLVSFIGGVQLLVLGIIGEYIGRIYDEVKARPIYVIAETVDGGQACADGP